MASQCEDVTLRTGRLANVYRSVLMDFIEGILDVFDTLNCYGCEVDHPSQRHHTCLMNLDPDLGPMAWGELLKLIDRSDVLNTVKTVMFFLDAKSDFSKALESSSRYDDILKDTLSIVGDIACKNGVLKRELISKAFGLIRECIGQGVVMWTRRCYSQHIIYNECLYDARIECLEKAAKRKIKDIDLASIKENCDRHTKHDDWLSFKREEMLNKLVKELKEEFDAMQDVNHVIALQKRYQSVSPMLKRAECVINRRPKSIPVHF